MPRKYRCPGCGKKVKFGTHFCSGREASEQEDYERHLDDPTPGQSELRKTIRQIGIILVASALIFALLWLSLGSLAFVFIAIVVLAIGAIVVFRPNRTDAGSGSSPGYRALVRLLRGDRNAAERLLKAEMERYPDFTRNECIRRVYDKLIYDRSR